MYFAYGWPRAYSAIPASASGGEAGEQEQIVHLHLDGEYCVVLSQRVIQIWTGGKNRVRLGQVVREDDSVEHLGVNIAGVWSTSRHQLAVLVRGWD